MGVAGDTKASGYLVHVGQGQGLLGQQLGGHSTQEGPVVAQKLGGRCVRLAEQLLHDVADVLGRARAFATNLVAQARHSVAGRHRGGELGG